MSRWQDRAACKGMDPNIFFPGRGEEPLAARMTCDGCVVRIECLEYALTTMKPMPGVWGGIGERERRKLRRLRKTKSA